MLTMPLEAAFSSSFLSTTLGPVCESGAISMPEARVLTSAWSTSSSSRVSSWSL
jgi:hypothetical protein